MMRSIKYNQKEEKMQSGQVVASIETIVNDLKPVTFMKP